MDYMTPDPYDHVREAFHTVADGLMDWEDPAQTRDAVREIIASGLNDVSRDAESRSNALGASYRSEDVDTLERAGESLMRLQDETNAIRLFALALRIRQELRRDVT